MKEVFNQNSKELRKNKDSENGTVKPIGIQACTESAKSSRVRLGAVMSTGIIRAGGTMFGHSST
jgi:hypothetical protein